MLCLSSVQALTPREGVVLIDSPLPKLIKFAYDGARDSDDCYATWIPYQGGPLDFANFATRRSFLPRHPTASSGYQESVEELLISRLKVPELVLPAPYEGSATAAILQRIVLSNWALTLRFLRRDFDSVNLNRLTNDSMDTSQTEYTLRNLSSCRNLLERCSVISRRNLNHLKIIPREDLPRAVDDTNTTSELLQLDWLFIASETRHCISETDQLINIRLASLSVLDSKRSRDDSRRNAMLSHSSHQISKLGQLLILFFTPAAFAYGMLSMGGDFLPGNKKFWIFWAVAVPLSVVTNGLFYLWNHYSHRAYRVRERR